MRRIAEQVTFDGVNDVVVGFGPFSPGDYLDSVHWRFPAPTVGNTGLFVRVGLFTQRVSSDPAAFLPEEATSPGLVLAGGSSLSLPVNLVVYLKERVRNYRYIGVLSRFGEASACGVWLTYRQSG